MFIIFPQVWKNRIWIWKPEGVCEKMNSNDRNIYAWSILDRYENHSNNLDDLCLTDFASSDISKIAVDGTVECEVLENYTLPVSDFCETPLCKKVIKLKNGLGEMRKGSRRQCVWILQSFETESVEHRKYIWNIWNIWSKYKELENARWI